MTKLDQLRTPICFPAWLRSIARRMAINRVVRRAPVTATEPEIMDSHCVELKTPLGTRWIANANSKCTAAGSTPRDGP